MLKFYMKIDGITGSSNDENYEGWIPVFNCNLGGFWGKSEPTLNQKHGANLYELYITKNVDKTSPYLYKACLERQSLKELIIDIVHKEGDKEKYMTMTLGKVHVHSFNTSGNEDTKHVTESLSFTYDEIEWSYYVPKEQRTEDIEVVSESFKKKNNESQEE